MDSGPVRALYRPQAGQFHVLPRSILDPPCAPLRFSERTSGLRSLQCPYGAGTHPAMTQLPWGDFTGIAEGRTAKCSICEVERKISITMLISSSR